MKKKPSMAGAYISYICILLSTIIFSIIYLQTFFYLLIVLEIALPIFSFLLSKYCFEHLTPELFLFPTSTLKNQEGKLFLRIHNKTRIPFASFGMKLTLRSQFYNRSEEDTHFFSLRANSDNELQFPITFTKCGLYEATLSDMEGYDYLHLFHFKKEISLSTRIHIMPTSQASDEKHEVIYSEGFDEFEESEKSGNVSANVTDIREYQPGDRLQKIHWKLSEKIDKLMVKENESTSTNEFFVLTELCQPYYDDSKEQDEKKTKKSLFSIFQQPELPPTLDENINKNMLDQTIEEAWSLGLEFINAKEIFTFAYYSVTEEDFVMSTIRNLYDMEKAFHECFYHPSYEEKDLALSIYNRAGLNRGTLLHVTHEGVVDVTDY